MVTVQKVTAYSISQQLFLQVPALGQGKQETKEKNSQQGGERRGREEKVGESVVRVVQVEE